jgi:hypothetical protein
LHHILSGIAFSPSRNMWGENLERFPYPEGNRHADVWFYEGQNLDRPSMPNTPWQIGRSLRIVRESTRVPVHTIFHIMWFHDASRNPSLNHSVEGIKPFLALIFSNGIGFWNHWPFYKTPAPNECEIAAAAASYLRFACRYGKYLYDLNITFTPTNRVKVKAPNHVYWQGNNFQRQFAGYEEVYVHLLNFDRPYLQAKLVSPDIKVPERTQDISVRVAVQQDAKRIIAYNISADGDQEPVEMEVKRTNGGAEVVVPLLEYWNLVLFRIYN